MLLLKNLFKLSRCMLATSSMCIPCLLPALSQAQPPAVHTLQLTLGVCRGEISVLSQQETEKTLDMEVQVAIADCEGSCQGSIEYLLVFTGADGREIQWQMNKTWEWRELDGPFTLMLHHDLLPGSKLQEVRNMKIGRCSCSS